VLQTNKLDKISLFLFANETAMLEFKHNVSSRFSSQYLNRFESTAKEKSPYAHDANSHPPYY